MVQHGVVEEFGETVALVQSFHRQVAVVHHVGEAAVGIDQQAAVLPLESGTNVSGRARPFHRAGADGGDRSLAGQRCVVAVDVCVVAEHVAAGVGAATAVVDPSGFLGDADVIAGHGGIIAADDRDRQHGRVREAARVAHGVVEAFAQAIARIQGFDRWVGIVNHIAVTAIGLDCERAIEPLQGRAHRAGVS